VKLVRPSVLYEHSFFEAYNAIAAENNSGFFKTEIRIVTFQEYCDTLIGYEKGIGLAEGYVKDTVLWLVDDDEYIGNISIRHELTEHLLNVGGHIGYIVAPKHRKKGYGTKILELGLKKAAKLGLKRVLVTCNDTNVASARIIEKNGGVLENKVFDSEQKNWKKRYWIDIPSGRNGG
jgi:predicted acetyltransferase